MALSRQYFLEVYHVEPLYLLQTATNYNYMVGVFIVAENSWYCQGTIEDSNTYNQSTILQCRRTNPIRTMTSKYKAILSTRKIAQ